MMKYRLGALVAAGLLAGGMSASSSTSAFAADLGGNCCADLEERIAELEATTARKGNRKVSLTVSGWVGQQVMWWDDGGEQNVYVHDLGTTLGSHVKFTGQATIVPGWSAGYVLHLEAMGSDSLTTSQNVPDGPDLLTIKETASATTTASARCSRSGSSRAMNGARCRLVSSRRLRTTRPFSLTVRARSFLPTGCRSTSTASSFATRTPELSPPCSGAVPVAASGVTATACRRTRFVTTRRRSVVSRCRHHGVKTTSGMSPHATPANGRRTNQGVRRGCVQPRFGFPSASIPEQRGTACG